MCKSFELIGEPLNLAHDGQRWFARILAQECESLRESSALVLGATPWLVDLFSHAVARTTVADASAPMIDLCERNIKQSNIGRSSPIVAFHQCDWLALPESANNLLVVAGDNSLTFLQYPNDWVQLLDDLANRMTEGGLLMCRFLSVCDSHRSLCPEEIVEAATRSPAPVNFTAVRAALLFSHWDPINLTVTPEDALGTFEKSRPLFDRLFVRKADNVENDLLSIEKYRGTGVKYFVPPLPKALSLFERRFHVRAVHFGPYEMSQYFPMVVASKRSERISVKRGFGRTPQAEATVSDARLSPVE